MEIRKYTIEGTSYTGFTRPCPNHQQIVSSRYRDKKSGKIITKMRPVFVGTRNCMFCEHNARLGNLNDGFVMCCYPDLFSEIPTDAGEV